MCAGTQVLCFSVSPRGWAKLMSGSKSGAPDGAACAALFTAGEFAAALAGWEAILLSCSLCPDTRAAVETNRGAALERLGRIPAAIAAYDLALQSAGTHVEALHNKGVALKSLNSLDEALKAFDAALQLRPSFVPSLRGRCDILCHLGRFEEAAETARTALAASQDAGPACDLGWALVKLKRYSEAIALYLDAKDRGDTSSGTAKLLAVALSHKAAEHERSGELQEAER